MESHPVGNGGFVVTPMAYFCAKGDLPMVRWLYVNGADPQNTDTDAPSTSPMYCAANRNRFEVCKWLYNHGAVQDVRREAFLAEGEEYIVPIRPLYAVFDGEEESRDLSRWLILKGALCKDDDDSGELDVDLIAENLFGDGEQLCKERALLLDWANEMQQNRIAFSTFLMGSLPPTEYSFSDLRKILSERLKSDDGTKRILQL